MDRYRLNGGDKLSVPIRQWYVSKIATSSEDTADVRQLKVIVARAKGILEGKEHDYRRRTYHSSYVSTQPDDPKCKNVDSLRQLCGERRIQEAQSINSRLTNGYYTDEYCDNACEPRVIQLPARTYMSAGTRKTKKYESEFVEDAGRDRQVWLAAIEFSDWDGATVWLDTYGNAEDAARAADRHADYYAAQCREDAAEQERLYRIEEAKGELKEKRRHCLKLIREYKQERAGIMQMLRDVLLDAIWDEVREICKLRKEVLEDGN